MRMPASGGSRGKSAEVARAIGSPMEPAAHRTHEGAGVARRAAHHERQRTEGRERAAEEADDDAPLAEEGAEAWVPASEVRLCVCAVCTPVTTSPRA